MDDKTKKLADQLARHDAAAPIAWGDDHTTLVPGVRTSWVDVYLEGICERLGWSWALSVCPPELDDGEPCERTIVLAYDRVVHAVWDPELYWFRPDAAVALPVGVDPDAAQLEALAAVVEAGEGRTLSSRPGYSVDALNSALADWARRHTGRADLRFAYDPQLHSARLARLAAAAEALDDAGEGTYEIAPGVSATGAVLDRLLEMDPEDAAEVTGAVLAALDDLLE